MHCEICEYKEAIDDGVKTITCRAIRQHPVFNHLSDEARRMLELDACINGLPYTTKDKEPLITIDPHAQGTMEANWPMEFESHHIENCKFYTLGKQAIGWEKI